MAIESVIELSNWGKYWENFPGNVIRIMQNCFIWVVSNIYRTFICHKTGARVMARLRDELTGDAGSGDLRVCRIAGGTLRASRLLKKPSMAF